MRRLAAGLLVMIGLAGAALAAEPPPLPAGATAERVDPASLTGWSDSDPRIPLSMLARGCAADPPLRIAMGHPAALARICSEAATLVAAGTDAAAAPPLRIAVGHPEALERICAEAATLVAAGTDPAVARGFFETRFAFWRVRPQAEGRGFMTGYFEPELAGAPARAGRQPNPHSRRPPPLGPRHSVGG